jgi:hexosaminidase
MSDATETTPAAFTGTPQTNHCLIPAPQRFSPLQGKAHLGCHSEMILHSASLSNTRVATAYRNWLSALPPSAATPLATVVLSLRADLSGESYSIRVSPEQIQVTAGGEHGLFHGLQTLIQLSRPWQNDSVVTIPCSEIDDTPAFAYRGMHLDVARHMYPVQFIKRFIDWLAYYKFNHFHWHLTDDQGWRIEIKSYPRLQEISAHRRSTIIGHLNDPNSQLDNVPYGGYYTHEQIRDIVAYAEDRYITILPEIEMPGHATAAVAAYPQLGCTGKSIEVATKWGIFEDVFLPSEETFSFLEAVLAEVLDLFPGKLIHLGGDECPKTQWKAHPLCQEIIRRHNLGDEDGLQSYFIQRIQNFLEARGRIAIGWDEILDGGLAKGAMVMSWRGEKGGILAAQMGHDVIMSPVEHCYFDSYQGNPATEPLTIGNFLPLEKVYHYDPVPAALSTSDAEHIIGAQGNLWTEYMPTEQSVEYMLFPRLMALAEAIWTRRPSNRGFKDFLTRLAPHLDKLEQDGVRTARHLIS